jgi:hypothetical protein
MSRCSHCQDNDVKFIDGRCDNCNALEKESVDNEFRGELPSIDETVVAIKERERRRPGFQGDLFR